MPGRREARYLIVDDYRIWTHESGLEDAPAVILVHGAGANHSWWAPMLPALESRFRVVRMDLSGHGESDHRRDGLYELAAWAREVAAVASDLGRPATLVGHSMGGSVSLRTAELVPHLVAGVATFDTVGLDGTTPTAPARPTPGAQRYYSTFDEIIRRFALAPAQPHPSDAVMELIGRASVRETKLGWTWKADQTRTLRPSNRPTLETVARLRCPLLFVRGGLSVFTKDDPLQALAVAQHGEEAIIRDVHHHLVLEAPEECAQLVGTLVDRIRLAE